jgi:hypothetical protein
MHMKKMEAIYLLEGLFVRGEPLFVIFFKSFDNFPLTGNRLSVTIADLGFMSSLPPVPSA